MEPTNQEPTTPASDTDMGADTLTPPDEKVLEINPSQDSPDLSDSIGVTDSSSDVDSDMSNTTDEPDIPTDSFNQPQSSSNEVPTPINSMESTKPISDVTPQSIAPSPAAPSDSQPMVGANVAIEPKKDNSKLLIIIAVVVVIIAIGIAAWFVISTM